VDAKLVFDPDGNLLNIYALPDADGDGINTAVAISPQVGDKFTDYVQSYFFNGTDEATYDYSLSEDVFTYGENGFVRIAIPVVNMPSVSMLLILTIT
jgi:hypothetical protein